jgi:competence protein ComEC
VVLIGIIFLLPLSFFPLLAKPAGLIVSWLIGRMNGYIEFIDRLPFSNWKPLMIDFTQAVLLYLMIIFLFTRITSRRSVQFFLLAGCMFAIALLRMFRIINARNQQLLIVYSIPRLPALELVSGQRSIFLGSDSLSNNPALSQRFLIPTRNKFRVSESFQIPDRGLPLEVIHFGPKKIIIVRKPPPQQLISYKKIICDLIIISGNPRLRMSELDSVFECKRYVFDSSNKRNRQKEWQQTCEKLGLTGHSVSDKGAFVMKIN